MNKGEEILFIFVIWSIIVGLIDFESYNAWKEKISKKKVTWLFLNNFSIDDMISFFIFYLFVTALTHGKEITKEESDLDISK